MIAQTARALVALGLVWYFVAGSSDPHAADFKSFYSAGFAITHPGIPLYDAKELADNPFGQVFKLPPTAALLLAPFSLGTEQQGRLAWRAGLVISYLAAFGLLCQNFGVRFLSWTWSALLAAWCLFAPAQISVGEGQWDPFFLLLLAAAAVGVQSTRPALAGLPLGLAASIKLYPIAAALFFVGRRYWSGLALTIAGLSALLLLGAVAVGFEETSVFVTQVLPASGATTAYPDNQALGGAIARLVSSDLKPFPLQAPGVDLAIRLVAVLATAAATWIIWRAPADDGFDRALQLALLVALSVLVVPVAWSHYQTILLLPLTLLTLDQSRHHRREYLGWLVLGVGFVLLALPNPAMIIGDDLDRALWLRSRADAANLALQRQFPTPLSRLLLSYKTLGALLVLGLTAWRVARAQPSMAPTMADSQAAASSLANATLAGARPRAAG
ncbi:MAG TPA: glycosyltransferase family 87 protein [Chloroflexota bacterium]|nr:glycosyltransferase family 87 protein [Chloroflexota bacterium]